MFKVKISPSGEKDDFVSFETKMPKIPNIGDVICFYVVGSLEVSSVDYISYEFDENNEYLFAEIHLL